MDITGLLITDTVHSACSAAMLLAMSRSIRDEETIKRYLSSSTKFKFVVTEIGGKSSYSEFQEKTTRAVLGACLNSGLIDKTPTDVHALLHATEEAKRGIIVNTSTSTSLAIKVAVVRDGRWLAVGMYGESAIHPITNHERAGLGVMHI